MVDDENGFTRRRFIKQCENKLLASIVVTCNEYINRGLSPEKELNLDLKAKKMVWRMQLERSMSSLDLAIIALWDDIIVKVVIFHRRLVPIKHQLLNGKLRIRCKFKSNSNQ